MCFLFFPRVSAYLHPANVFQQPFHLYLLSCLCLTFLATPCEQEVNNQAFCRKGSPWEAVLFGAVMHEAGRRLQGNIVCPTVWPCYQDTAVTCGWLPGEATSAWAVKWPAGWSLALCRPIRSSDNRCGYGSATQLQCHMCTELYF